MDQDDHQENLNQQDHHHQESDEQHDHDHDHDELGATALIPGPGRNPRADHRSLHGRRRVSSYMTQGSSGQLVNNRQSSHQAVRSQKSVTKQPHSHASQKSKKNLKSRSNSPLLRVEFKDPQNIISPKSLHKSQPDLDIPALKPDGSFTKSSKKK